MVGVEKATRRAKGLFGSVQAPKVCPSRERAREHRSSSRSAGHAIVTSRNLHHERSVLDWNKRGLAAMEV